MRVELDAAMRVADAEPDPALRLKMRIRAHAAALKSAWQDG
jgi:hypothetical protein